MKKYFIHFMLVSVVLVLAFGSAYATRPGKDVNPNGFPSGEHYNLNIHGKKAEFTCPDQEYYLEITDCLGDCGVYSVGQLVETCPDGFSCSITSTPIYGNSIFVPQDGSGIEIYMQSGKVGGRGKKATALPQAELWAIDPCAGFDGDGAIIQLPPGEYDVYVRALAKPTDGPSMTVSPFLFAAEDESGNNLVWLGLLTEDGFQTLETETTYFRRKGRSKAIDITGLFTWTGEVCYIENPGSHDYTKTYCCYDYEADGIYDYCCFDVSGDQLYTQDECSGNLDEFVEGACTEITAYCIKYVDKWVLGIADFVEYMWGVENDGLKLLQVRFYPR
jgi:hypothetical protein